MSAPLSHSQTKQPVVLFHASRNPHITILEPHTETTRDFHEGPRIFATPSRALASMFLVESDDSWVQSGLMDDAPYIIIYDEVRYRNMDTGGGAIYALPSETFECDSSKGLGRDE